jgi:hypothetical protein
MKKNRRFTILIAAFLILLQHKPVFGQSTLLFHVNQPQSPLLVDAGGSLQLIEGGAVQLGGNPTASGGYGNYQYAWDNAEYLNDASIANPTASGLTSATTFTLSVSDSAGVCVKQAQVVVDVIASLPNYNTSSNNLSINPNPFFDFIQLDASQPLLNVSLCSITGQSLIVSQNLNASQNIRIETSHLPEGIYLVCATYVNGTQQFKKLCKTATH